MTDYNEIEEGPYYDGHADWSIIPPHMHGAIRRYVMHGISPGQFLTAVLSNDLMEAFGRADDDNVAAMHGWVRFLCNYMPSQSKGSPDAFRAWINRGGLIGNGAGQ